MRVALNVLVSFAALSALSACSLEQYEPSEISLKRVELVRGQFEREVSLSGLDSSLIESLAESWQRYGDGPMELNVLYDPSARTVGAVEAGKQAARLAEAMKLRGVAVQTGILPVSGRGESLAALISYPQTTARPPEGCGPMPGMGGSGPDFGKTGLNDGYRAGCGIEAIMAKQISRPSDLRGREGLKGPSDGRRVYQQTGAYRGGVANEPLDGEQASD